MGPVISKNVVYIYVIYIYIYISPIIHPLYITYYSVKKWAWRNIFQLGSMLPPPETCWNLVPLKQEKRHTVAPLQGDPNLCTWCIESLDKNHGCQPVFRMKPDLESLKPNWKHETKLETCWGSSLTCLPVTSCTSCTLDHFSFGPALFAEGFRVRRELNSNTLELEGFNATQNDICI